MAQSFDSELKYGYLRDHIKCRARKRNLDKV